MTGTRLEKPRMRALTALIALIMMITLTVQSFASYGTETEDDEVPEDFLSYIVLEQDSGQVLYTQNAYMIADPALLSKLMCAVVVMEYSADGKKILVTDSVTPKENSVSKDGKFKLYAGASYTVGNLLRALLLGGADNCARALAAYINPNTEYFVTVMNQTAAKLSMKDTYFTSPDGAYSTLSRTSVNDFAILYDYALKIPTVRNIIQSEFSHIWDNTAVFNLCSLPFSLKNTYGTSTAGGLFFRSGDDAPGTIAVNITLPQSVASDVPLKLILVVRDSVTDEELMTLTRSLIADSYAEFHKTRVYKAGEKIADCPVAGQTLDILAVTDFYMVVPSDTVPSAYIQSITYSFSDDGYNPGQGNSAGLRPPITERQELGTASLLLKDGSTFDVRIMAGNTIQTNNPGFNSFLNMVGNNKPLFIVIAVLLAVELYVATAVIISKIRKNREKKRLDRIRAKAQQN
ncbi:MAG: D-alanyl-D-alanine carboxypeptidase [Clostridia bacterium]|nr:D-alanyl-D-alanine carboxypeptidase [Clostridia bacterium]